jgi:tetratricopeptide (TPR) repeat protein
MTLIPGGLCMNQKELFESAQRLFIEGKLSESIIRFSEAMEAGEKTEIAYLSRGVAYLRSNEKDKAIDDFSSAVDMNNHNTRAHFYRGIVYMTNEKFREAIWDFDITISLQPENGAAFFARGTAYAQIGDDIEAARDIKKAIMYSESDTQEFADTIGLFRTQLDKVMMIMDDGDDTPTLHLTNDEVSRVRRWLDDESFH